jgi:hypothetical protein
LFRICDEKRIRKDWKEEKAENLNSPLIKTAYHLRKAVRASEEIKPFNRDGFDFE